MAYEKLIMESCGCTATEAPVVEEFMRGEHPTLDGLSKTAFRKEARACLEVMRHDTKFTREFAATMGLPDPWPQHHGRVV